MRIPNKALIVATSRPWCFKTFMDKWRRSIDFGADVLLVVMHDTEDNEQTQELMQMVDPVYRESMVLCNHISVAEELKDGSWIIPKRSGACKSYGIFKAWKMGADYIIVLDDDCYPYTVGLVETHVTNLLKGVHNHTFPTITGVRPRGVPYLEKIPVALSHGLWMGTPDVDGITGMIGYGRHKPVIGPIPNGAAFTMCGMNIAFTSRIAPLLYFGIQGPDWGVERYDDIWCGFIAKKILDHLGLAVWNGQPYIYHARASDRFRNLIQEASGYKLNCWFYEWIMKDYVSEGRNPIECMADAGKKIRAWSVSLHGEHAVYFDRYGEAIEIWASQFRS